MKIAFFSNCYLPYQSGITLSVQILTNELQSLGHAVQIVGPTYPGHKERDPNIIRLFSLPATYPGYRLVFPFSFKLSKIKPDVIHAHQPFGVGLIALYLARKLKVPLVYTFHTLFPRYVHHVSFLPTRFIKWLVASYLSWYCNQVDTIVVPSEMVRRYLAIALQIRKPIKVIPTGVKLEFIKDRGQGTEDRGVIRKKHSLPPEARLLLYTGRISEEKGLPFLLEAFSKISPLAKDAYLLLVGGGPKEKEYKKLAQSLRLRERAIFTGPVKHEQIYDYYLAADLFVYSSTSETQGLVLVEAKACGLPVVAIFGGGISDVVRNGEDGYVIAKNQTLFVEHVLRLLKNEKLRKKMSVKAGEDVSDRFSSKVITQKMIGIYKALTDCIKQNVS